jgi:hypothetical protein
MPAATGDRIFGGYKHRQRRHPHVSSTVENGQPVEDTLRPVKNGFERSVKINGKETKEELSW